MKSSARGTAGPTGSRPILRLVEAGASVVARREDSAARSPVDVEVVIPAYNESGRLPATLEAMVGYLAGLPWESRIVVVDNGSVDDTAGTVLSVAGGGVDVVAIGCSRAGKGAAVQRGLRTSRSRIVGFTDADLSTPLETLVPAVAALDGGAAAAIASRHAPGASLAIRQPLTRRLGGNAFRRYAGPLVPGIHDTQCGFKFFDRDAVRDALWRTRSTGFVFDVELLRRIHDGGGRIVEIPVTWTDAEGSSLRPVRDGLSSFAAVARLRRDLARDDPARDDPARDDPAPSRPAPVPPGPGAVPSQPRSDAPLPSDDRPVPGLVDHAPRRTP